MVSIGLFLEQWPKLRTPGSPMAKTGYPLPRYSQGAILMANARPDPTLAEFETGPPDSGYSSPHRPPDLNHTYRIMAGLFDRQPTRARVIDAAGHFCGRRGRACGRTLTLLCSLYVCDAPIIDTSYQKLPFGSGDDPDKLFFLQQ